MTHGATARLFVAVDPPGDVRRGLAGWARTAVREVTGSARERAALRVLDPELLHVTLCFLGNRPVEEIEPIGDRLAACAGPVGELSVGAPLWLPPRRPRALAVELHDEEHKLARLQADVSEALEDLAPHSPGETRAKRRFRAHITVARIGRGATFLALALPPTPALSFVPSDLVLYRSWLSPDGASYETVARYVIG